MSGAPERLAAALADRYRLEREVGSGGMATVYLAEDLRHGRRVALKVLRPELAATLGSDRFFREIQVAARLQHPHILPLHDSGEADGFLFYVMPFVEGESLRERLARGGELPVHDAVRILVEVTDALASAHQQGVVHRDIKPDNVMLSGRHALVTDFGVAKAVSEATGRQQLTTAGVALGTPAYMAPEQAAADPNLDHRVDIYAVGAMGYELLTGRPPFTGMTSQQILAAHVTQAPDPVTRHRPSCPPALEAVIMRCLAKRAADRWQTAEELLQQLEPLATPSGGMTPTQTRPVSAVTGAAGRRRFTAPALLIGTALIAVAGWYATRGRPATAPQLERVQLTSTGNAASPAISADGKRVAYLVRRCDGDGGCTMDVVAQDVDGSGIATVARGFLSAGGMEWSADGRHLIVNASRGPAAWGVFSVPILGGEPRLLGCCFGSMAGPGDTVLVSGLLNPGDSVGWVRRVSLTDGAVHDSFAVPIAGGPWFQTKALGDRALVTSGTQVLRILVADRDGTSIDSVLYPAPGFEGVDPLPEGRGFVVWAIRGDRSGVVDLLRYRVNASGRIASRPDTLLRQLPLTSVGQLGRNGAVVYDAGPIEYTVRALTRAGTGLQYAARELAQSTTFLGASLFGNGTRILLYRTGADADAPTQFSLLPFDSGPELILGPPVPLIDFDPSQDGGSMILATRLGADSALISRVEVPSGRSARVLAIPARDYYRLETTGGGGFVLQTGSTTLRTVGIRGVPDTAWRLPDSMGTIDALDPSPNGQAAVTLGWNLAGDSVMSYRVSLLDGSARPLGAFGAEGFEPPRWFTDGTVLLPIHESHWTMAWYQVPAGGGPVLRVGPAPRFPATYRFSADGQRAVERQSEPHPDVFLIPDFGTVLRQ